MLATAVSNTIIEQFELACLKAGLLPLGVGFSSLDILDLFRSTIKETSQTASRRSQGAGRESLFLYLAGWGFSFIALGEGVPAFVRVKHLRLLQRREAQLQSAPPLLAQQDPATNPGSPQLNHSMTSLEYSMPETQNQSSATEIVRMLTNELVATLQYYLESFQSTSWEGQTLPLYIAEGLEQGGTVLPAIQEIETMLKSSMGDSPQINLLTFSDHLKSILPKGDKPTPHTFKKALPAYASVMVAP